MAVPLAQATSKKTGTPKWWLDEKKSYNLATCRVIILNILADTYPKSQLTRAICKKVARATSSSQFNLGSTAMTARAILAYLKQDGYVESEAADCKSYKATQAGYCFARLMRGE
jgi:hypothetical protein